MAEFRCRACGKEGAWVYDPEQLHLPPLRFHRRAIRCVQARTFRRRPSRQENGRARSRASQDDGAAHMKVITIIDDEERARSIYVRPDGDVTVFDRDRKFRFRTEVAGAATTWQLLDPRSLPPKVPKPRDIYIPDLHIGSIKVKTRDFR
jgi:hypothetical protein